MPLPGLLPTLPTFGRAARHLDRDLTPQEEEEINRSLVQRGISGLTGAANILDIPGSMIRDVLALENPLDQLLPWNWTSEEGRVRGHELWGYDKDATGWTPGIAGFATEVLLDPLTYLSFGASAATKAGRVAKSAGMWDDIAKVASKKMGRKVGAREARRMVSLDDMVKYSDEVTDYAGDGTRQLGEAIGVSERLSGAAKDMGVDLAKVADDPLGSFARWKAPGLPGVHMNAPSIPFAGQKADVVLDQFGNWLKYETAAGRAMNQMFRPSVMGTTTEAFQRDIAPPLYKKKREAEALGRQAGSEMESVLVRNLDDLEKVHDFQRPIADLMEGLEEGVPVAGDWVSGAGIPASAKVLKVEDTGEAWIRWTDPDTGALVTKGFDADALATLKRDSHRTLMSHPDVVTATYKMMDMPADRLAELSLSRETMEMVGHVRETLGAMKGEADEWGANFMELYGVEAASHAGRRLDAEKALEAAGELPGALPPGAFPTVESLDRQIAIDAAQRRLDDLDEFVAPEMYFPRLVAREGAEAAASRGPMYGADPHLVARMAATRGFKDSGTGAIREMTQDPHLSQLLEAGKVEEAAAYIGNKYKKRATEVFEEARSLDWTTDPATGLRAVDVTKDVTTANRWDALANWMKGMVEESPEMMQAGVYVDPVSALTRRVSTFNDYLESTKAVVRTVSSNATNRATEGSMTVSDIVSKMKLKASSFSKETGEGAEVYQKIAKLMGRHVDDPEEMKKVIKEIAEMHVTKDVADNMMRFHQSFKDPEVISDIAKAFDTATNLIKGSLTAPWMAFHTRNGISGQIRNWVAGLVDLRELPGAVRAARHVAKGGVLEGSSEIPALERMFRSRVSRGLTSGHLDDAAATDLLREMFYVHSPKRQAGEVFERTGGRAAVDPVTGDVLSDALGGKYVGGLGGDDAAPSVMDMFGTWFGFGKKVPEAAGPLNLKAAATRTRGVSDRAISGYGPFAAGEMLGQYVEDLNRLAPFINQLKRGVDPAEAMRRISAAQVDYSSKAYTAVEREIAQRMFPFWKFSSRQVPFVIRELTERPGGRLGRVMRAGRLAKQDQTRPLPEYLQQGMAVEVPSGPSGDPRYLTTLDLMSMDPFSFMPTRGSEVLTTPLMEGMSRLNPMVKFLAEAGTGQTFFQRGPMGGRRLEDLDPTMGRTVANISDLLTGERTGQVQPLVSQTFEHAMLNSPFSRALTTARTLTDPRKGLLGTALNLGTGFRVSDLPPRTQEALLREAAEAAILEIPGGKTFRNVYLPEDLLATMSPAEREHAERLRDLKRMLAKRAKERAEAARMAQL